MLAACVTCFQRVHHAKQTHTIEREKHLFWESSDSGERTTGMFKLLPLCQMPTIAASDESEIHGVGELPVPPYVFAWPKKTMPSQWKKWKRLPKWRIELHESQQPGQPVISCKSRSRAPKSEWSAVVLSEGEEQAELGILQWVMEWWSDTGTDARVSVILRAETRQARVASTWCSVRKRLHLSPPPTSS